MKTIIKEIVKSSKITDFLKENQDTDVFLINTLVTTDYLDSVPVLVLLVRKKMEIKEKILYLFTKIRNESNSNNFLIMPGMPSEISPSPLPPSKEYQCAYVLPTVTEKLIEILKEVSEELKWN